MEVAVRARIPESPQERNATVGSVRLDTSTRISPADAAAIEWRAAGAELERHAFPRRDGFPARALCGLRWTAAFGHHGNAWCQHCLAGLREQLAATTRAIAMAEAEQLAAGDFYAGMDR